jgi:threonylcarbamoyladenosine tRNA methylthiotransferase MtaB
MSVEVATFGCRLNAYESEIMRGLTRSLSDTFIVNTCAVTGEAERQARQAIRRAHRDRPDRAIVVTGCAAQISPARWAALPGVSHVLGNSEKLEPASWENGSVAGVSDIMSARHIATAGVHGFAGRARALVQIQQGCDHACTFCVIPFGRGRNRSVRPETILERTRALVSAGYQEVVLTGVDICSFGTDFSAPIGLGALVRRLLAEVPRLARLRLSSLDPAAIDGDLWDVIANEPRFMPYLHLSLQSASTLILKRMRRRHTAEQACELIGRARSLRPGIVIGADLIAGFPTETDALFAETIDWVRQHALPYLHVFPYSERPGTPAARMPSVPHAVRRERAAVLRAAASSAAADLHAAHIGSFVELLTEAGSRGHTPHFAPVHLPRELPPGLLLSARVTGADANGLQVAL